jgi:hypothetical protein
MWDPLHCRHARCLGVIALLVSGCASPDAGDPIAEPIAFPPLEAVIGAPPADEDIVDDVKADGPLPASYTDLVAQQSGVRSQGSRGVCTIFTSTALLEHLAVRAGQSDADFSEQFLQWSQKRERPGAERTEASTLPEVMENLAVRGTIAEAVWPYEQKPWWELGHTECVGLESAMPIGCLTNGEPSAAALAAARQKLPVGRYLRTSAIKAYLYDHKTPVAVGLDVIEGAWSYPPTVRKDRPGAWERGEVPYPTALELKTARSKPRIGHAILIVGWDDDYEVPVLEDDGRPRLDASGRPVVERGFYVFKNSWGATYWGKSNPHGPGYGLISQRYVNELGSAYVVGLPTGTALPTTGVRHDGAVNVVVPDGRTVRDVIEPDEGGPMSAASIEISIAHARLSDLTVKLEHDDRFWTLWQRSPSAETAIRGVWNLNGDFSRVDRGGPWILTIEDAGGGISGTLERWSLTLR